MRRLQRRSSRIQSGASLRLVRSCVQIQYVVGCCGVWLVGIVYARLADVVGWRSEGLGQIALVQGNFNRLDICKIYRSF
jgi:hypothetical protein